MTLDLMYISTDSSSPVKSSFPILFSTQEHISSLPQRIHHIHPSSFLFHIMPSKTEADHIILLLAILEHTEKIEWNAVAKATGLYKDGKFV